MNDLVKYIISEPNIKNVVFLGGEDSPISIIFDLMFFGNLDSIAVYLPQKVQKRLQIEIRKDQDLIKKVYSNSAHVEVIDRITELTQLPENTALVFDEQSDVELLRSLSSLSPTWLIGAKRKTNLTSFEIWEWYRKCTQKIIIVSWIDGGRSETLRWEKSETSDVELSVIFPMYKVEKYLPKCIESVSEWKAPYVEYLFVDDGSPDHCADVVRKAAETDPRIKLLQKKNGGCASARQFGLEHATGRYVGFIDPDDYIDESMFRKLLRRAMIGSYEICYCGYNELYEDTGKTKAIPDLLGRPFTEGTVDPEQINQLRMFLRVAIWRGIYRKDMLDRNKIAFYTDLPRFDDLPFKFQVFSVAKSVASVAEPLYYYRMSRPGQDVSANDERLYVHFPIFKHLDDFVNEKGRKELFDALQVVKLHTHRYALEKLLPEYVPNYLKQAREDLLSNMSFKEVAFVYRKESRWNKAYFMAIMMNSSFLITKLLQRKRYQSDKNMSSSKKISQNLKAVTEFTE